MVARKTVADAEVMPIAPRLCQVPISCEM